MVLKRMYGALSCGWCSDVYWAVEGIMKVLGDFRSH
jgi:hypothetical protein